MAITPISRKRVIYTDFGNDLTPHPVSADVSRKINEEAVKQSIRNIVLTNRGERPFNPEFGSDIKSLFFENINQDTLANLQTMIITAIENFEPRAELIDVLVRGRQDSNEIEATITFQVINNEEPTVLNVILNRVR